MIHSPAETLSVAAPVAERLAYVPPKLELLDAAQTELVIVTPVGDDGIFYS